MHRLISLSAILAAAMLAVGCSTAPKAEDQSTIRAESRNSLNWFKTRVTGLDRQLADSAGYISYPAIGQYGIIISGGKFGRGVVYDNKHRQIGWAYINTVSLGLQAGAQGYKMLVVFENYTTLDQFKEDKLTGNVGATAVAGESSAEGTASFTNGVAIYQGDATGLMAGASVGLDWMRFEAN